jgi:hypothetical protein
VAATFHVTRIGKQYGCCADETRRCERASLIWLTRALCHQRRLGMVTEVLLRVLPIELGVGQLTPSPTPSSLDIPDTFARVRAGFRSTAV